MVKIREVDGLLDTNVTLENQINDIQVISPKPFTTLKQSSKIKKCKRRKLEEADKAFYSGIANCFREVADAMKEGNKILERTSPRVYTSDEIYKELEPMGLEQDILLDAIIYLGRNQTDARTLFTCSRSIRMRLFKKMMGLGDEVSLVTPKTS